MPPRPMRSTISYRPRRCPSSASMIGSPADESTPAPGEVLSTGSGTHSVLSTQYSSLRSAGARRLAGLDLVDLDRPRHALQLDFVDLARVDEVPHGEQRALADEHLAGLRALGQATGQAHVVADDSVVQSRGRADVADRHVAGADADAQGQDLLRLHEP